MNHPLEPLGLGAPSCSFSSIGAVIACACGCSFVVTTIDEDASHPALALEACTKCPALSAEPVLDHAEIAQFHASLEANLPFYASSGWTP